MAILHLDLKKLHGFRLLAAAGSDQAHPNLPATLEEMLGARLGAKIGNGPIKRAEG